MQPAFPSQDTKHLSYASLNADPHNGSLFMYPSIPGIWQ